MSENSSSSESQDSPSHSPNPPPRRLHHHLRALTPQQRAELLDGLGERELATLLYDWVGAWARDAQLPPSGEWFVWLVLAGRGFGKTRTGAETVRHWVESRRARRIGLIAPTAAAARDVMVEGESGILACSPPWYRPKYEPSKRRLTWPGGEIAQLFSAEEPDQLRGPQFEKVWGDEPASWLHDEAWSNCVMGLRLGSRPQAIITGTPKPVPLILDWIKSKSTHVTRGSTYDNAGNLAPQYLAEVTRLYKGTRLGRQELHAEVLEAIEGVLFSQVLIDKARVTVAPTMERIVVAVDPAPTSAEGSDETGIVVVGRGYDGHGYVLEDCTVRGSPDTWGRAAVKAFYVHKADCIVAETNCGGDMVEANVRTVDPNVSFKPVRAMRGKAKRAEPIAALYEQGKIHHVGEPERLEKLERQMRRFTGVNGKRDDRTDAACWGLHELLLDGVAFGFV